MQCAKCEQTATVWYQDVYYCDECYDIIAAVRKQPIVSLHVTFDDLDLEKKDQLRVFKEVAEERIRQDEQWGGPAHDDLHRGVDWLNYIDLQIGKAEEENYDGGLTSTRLRERLVKIAALAVAGIESIDRKAK